MPDHSNLTGADLHEPKGVAGASSNTAYFADGNGSGSWTKVDKDKVDTSSIKNINKGKLYVSLGEISATGSVLVPFTAAVSVDKITTVIDGSFGTSDAVIDVKNAAGSSMGTITIANSGSGKGDTDTLSPSSNNSVSADSWMELEVSTAAGSAVNCTVMIEYTLT